MSFADIDIIGEDLEVNAFSGSGYVMAFFGVCNLLMMIFLWAEPPKCKKRNEKKEKKKDKKRKENKRRETKRKERKATKRNETKRNEMK